MCDAGVVVRLIPVERNGRIEWMADEPDVCRRGHADLRSSWQPCTCGKACTHWVCQTCGDVSRDDEHVCQR